MHENQPRTIRSRWPEMPSLPLIRLSTAMPVLAALDRRGLPTDAVLEGMGLTRAAVESPDTFVPAILMYQFCEEAAKAAKDKHFMANIGEAINTAEWPPLVEASSTAKTIGNFLTTVAIVATEHSSATEQTLEVRGRNAFFSAAGPLNHQSCPRRSTDFSPGSSCRSYAAPWARTGTRQKFSSRSVIRVRFRQSFTASRRTVEIGGAIGSVFRRTG